MMLMMITAVMMMRRLQKKDDDDAVMLTTSRLIRIYIMVAMMQMKLMVGVLTMMKVLDNDASDRDYFWRPQLADVQHVRRLR